MIVITVASPGKAETIATVWGRNTFTLGIVLLSIGALFVLVWRFRRRKNTRRSPVTLT
jgi:heme/copper-type cytochrome/quinol oxidase subunit 2